MSYDLIAREGYAGLGALPTTLSMGGALQTAASGAGAQPTPADPSTLSKIGGYLKDAFNIYSGQQQQAGQLQAYQTIAQQQAAARAGAGLPAWVLPVAVVGGLGVVALVLLKQKRKNPAKRRRAKGGGRHVRAMPRRARRRR